MSQLLSQLGINWELLVSQGVNFLLLLVILRLFVYKPLLKVMHDRRQKIEEGITKAKMADERLHEVDVIGKGKIREAETAALSIIKKTENDAKELEGKLFAEAKRKEAAELANAQTLLRAQEEESRRGIRKEAAEFVRRALVKAVELSPEKIDDALIAKAVQGASVGAGSREGAGNAA